MNRFALPALVLALFGLPLALGAGACSGSDDSPADASVPATDTTPIVTTDAAPSTCFDFSLDPGIPLAIDGTFIAASETWLRPDDGGEVCPASQLSASEVPFVAFSFCNTDTVPHTFDFEMITDDGPNGELPLDDAYLVLYTGQEIPSDPKACLAINDNIPKALNTNDSEILGVTVPAGGAITVVGSAFDFAPADDVGTGYYILVVTSAE
tara:strand:+ start:39862 stop:40491 length:630 start_codon:yes stop_codon:yes gene_type:complete